ncbi:hypothetical protein CHS0354_005538, partial [Potamilus streckersoni]
MSITRPLRFRRKRIDPTVCHLEADFTANATDGFDGLEVASVRSALLFTAINLSSLWVLFCWYVLRAEPFGGLDATCSHFFQRRRKTYRHTAAVKFVHNIILMAEYRKYLFRLADQNKAGHIGLLLCFHSYPGHHAEEYSQTQHGCTILVSHSGTKMCWTKVARDERRAPSKRIELRRSTRAQCGCFVRLALRPGLVTK